MGGRSPISALREQFLYLAVVLDGYSRRVVGWALGESLEASLAVAALRQAIIHRKPGVGLVHHSDRGTQYASREYIAVLAQTVGSWNQVLTWLHEMDILRHERGFQAA